MSNRFKLDHQVTRNFMDIKLWFYLPAFLMLIAIFLLVLTQDGNYIDAYVGIQKDSFFYLNEKLSTFPNIQFNLTQLGDVFIVFPFVMILIRYAPRFWEALITSSLLSLGISAGLKELFSVPRPAKVFDNNSFTIIGETLKGYTSLPSGHSMTIFIVITLLLFAFMPQKSRIYKVLWAVFMLIVGFIIASSRVGVGAHHPLDTIAGASVGYMLAIIGIQITNKIGWWRWIRNKKYLPIFIVIFSFWVYVLINKIIHDHQLIFDVSLIVSIISLYLIVRYYIQKKAKN